MPAAAKEPSRIVSTMPNLTEILFDLGLGDKMVGVTELCNYPPQAQVKAKVGGLLLNWEQIVALKPDLVVFLAGARPQEEARAQQLGLKVLTVKMDSLDEMLEGIKRIGIATGARTRSIQLVQELDGQIKAYKRQSKSRPEKSRARAYVWLGGQPLVTAGPGTFINELIELAGGKNIAADLKGKYPQVGWEFLVKEQPDIIVMPQDIMSSAGELDKYPLAGQLRAVRNDQVLIVNGDLLTRPSPRFVEAVRQLSERFYLTKLDFGK